jgi:CRP-like cAMP-binding protein
VRLDSVSHPVITRCKAIDRSCIEIYALRMAEQRVDQVRDREKARGAVRGLYLSEFAAIGRRRSAALRAADEELDRLARLLRNAVDAGIGMAEISRESGVSRPTLYQLRARYGATERDLRIAVLQATLERGDAAEMAEELGIPREQVDSLVAEFEAAGWIRFDPEEEFSGWALTMEGLHALEEWTFEPADEREGSHDER